MKFVTRAEWGARAPRHRSTASLRAVSTGHWNGGAVTIGGETTFDHRYCASLVRGTQNFHMDEQGWSDIAYNFVVCQHGYVFEGRGLNVINGANGTNTANASSHAVMALSGQGNPFTDEEKLGYVDCIKYIDANTAAPYGSIGHRDHKATECPGGDRYGWIHSGMPLPVTEPEKPKVIMFLPGTDVHAIVDHAYQTIVGRPPENADVRATWAWTLASEQGAGYAKLNHMLQYEIRLRQEAQLKSLAQQLANLENPQLVTLELTPEVEQKILARVWADLTDRIND